MNQYSYKISLRVTHPDRNIDVLCHDLIQDQALHIVNKWSAGEQMRTQDGNALEGLYTHSYCCLVLTKEKTSSDVETLSSGLSRAINTLGRFTENIKDCVTSGGEAVLSIGLFVDSNAGDVLTNDLMKKIAGLGLGLSIDIYP